MRPGRIGLLTIRKSSTPRSDRIQVTSIDNGNDIGTDSCDGNAEDKRKYSAKNDKGKTPLSPEMEVKAGKSAIGALANDNDNVETSDDINEMDLRGKEDEKRKTIVTTKTITKLLHPEDLAQYQEAEDVQKKALKKIEAARWKVYNDQVQQIWGVYTYGLKHVLALNDLSDAPDAILPGNF